MTNIKIEMEDGFEDNLKLVGTSCPECLKTFILLETDLIVGAEVTCPYCNYTAKIEN